MVPEANPTKRGPDALVENVGQVYEAFGEVSWKPVEIVELGDRILVRVQVTGKGKTTSLPIDEDIGHVYTLNREDRATKLDIFRTWDEARAYADDSSG